MKRITYLWLGVLVMASMATTASLAQSGTDSLAEYARARKKEKPAPTKKVYDNENLPQDEHISVVGPAPSDEKASSTSSDPNPSKPSADTAATAKSETT